MVGEALKPNHTIPSHAVRWCQCPMGPIPSDAGIIQFSTSVANQANSNHCTQGCVASKARLNYAPPDRAEQCYGMDEDGTGVGSLSRHRRPGAFGQICR